MMYVAFGALGVAAVTAIVLGNLLRIVIRQGARERDLLVNQICHLANKPWQEAPAYVVPDDAGSLSMYAASPEQLPDGVL